MVSRITKEESESRTLILLLMFRTVIRLHSNLFRAIRKQEKVSVFKSSKMATMSPAESGEFIVKNAKFVKVHEEGIKHLAKEVRA